jgi:aspartyl-tRNA synthetase
MEKLKRSHMAGTLRIEDIGKEITLAGWVQKRRDLGGLIFVDLRDKTGISQIVFDQDVSKEAFATGETLGSEYVIIVKGKVLERHSKNLDMPTGEVEIFVKEVEVLNEAKTPPIYIKDDDQVSENLRLKYRYLDLRKNSMQQNLKLRHDVTKLVREFLDNETFVEVETPILTKPTPEGARDYIVPSRVNQGKFYALPQSPQLFKQLLMVSGTDRYFQIVKCFRDEDLRADRQPEFTQIDCEMSFVDEEDIMDINERMMAHVLKNIKGVELSLPFPRITYEEAMNRYGNDKPDTRFELELIDVTDSLKSSDFKVFSSTIEKGGIIKAINVTGEAENFSRKDITNLEKYTKDYGAKGLAWIKVTEEGINSPIAKFLSDTEIQSILDKTQGKTGDLLLFVADEFQVVHGALSNLRNYLGKALNLYKEDQFNFLWVTEFPLFERDQETNRLTAMHHPFTAPIDEDLLLLEKKPEDARARAYDIVLNGHEIGGGSIRIHTSNIQEKMFDALGFSKEEAYKKFGFLLEAFQFGTPPHGGIAYGLDRLVMILANEDNIRQVIAFPKTQNATCLLTDAPTSIDDEQLAELHINVKSTEEST